MKLTIFPKMLSFVIPFLEVIKMAIVCVASVSLLGFAGLTFAGSAVGLVVSAPIFIIFSPILVPATVATTLLATGLTAGASLGGTALGLIMWLIKHRIGVKPKDNAPPPGVPPTTDGGSSALSAKTFFGTFVDKPVDGDASADGAAPSTSATPPPTNEAPPKGGVKWTWTRSGKTFSGGWFGGSPADGGASADGNSPGIVLHWSWTSWLGKTYSGNVPFGGIPTSGGTLASGAPVE